MSNLKKIIFLLVLAALVFITKNHFIPGSQTQKNVPIVAITQIVEHPSLDQEREGIIASLEKRGYMDGKNVRLIYQNAQGNVATAAQLVKQVMGQQPTVLVAISTPSAQAAITSCQAQNVPLVFTAVTDPIHAKLIKSFDQRNDDFEITGVCDALPASSQLDMIKKFVPDLKKLGVIYNAGEVNSVMMVKELKDACDVQHITVVESTASKTSDVTSAVTNLVGKVDGIYVPNDNTAVASISSIVQVAEKYKLPVFAGDVGSVANGALATYGYDRRELGIKAGHMVADILEGKKASKISVVREHLMKMFVNKASAEKTGTSIPTHILSTATFVGD
jgi:putative tryptophan/tyrosine transport system substrate-binding protein